jgi:hypothetical protein
MAVFPVETAISMAEPSEICHHKRQKIVYALNLEIVHNVERRANRKAPATWIHKFLKTRCLKGNK